MARRCRWALCGAVVGGAMLALPAPASASLDDLLGGCTLRDASDGNPNANGNPLPFRLCDDDVPDFGGTVANENGVKAVKVPAKYDGFLGLPAKAGDAGTVPGSDTGGNVALDADVTLPDPVATPMPANGYPLVVMMHGCCSGNKTSWEASTIDAGGERWHYSNAWFAARGYVVLTYTARGFVREDAGALNGGDDIDEGSTGQNQLDSRRYEINDYQHLAGQLVDYGDLDKDATRLVKVDPQKVVVTGGSYGGGFSWLALTDPTWSSPNGTPMRLAAAAPKYGWSDLMESLVPNGFEPKPIDPNFMNPANANYSKNPIGFAKRSIVAGLYGTGKASQPGSSHTTFPPEIDNGAACLESADPYELNPVCTQANPKPVPDLVLQLLNDSSSYYQNDFFAGLSNSTIQPVPLFSAGTLTDPLFPPMEHRRMVERLKAAVANYPVKEYYGDYQHFVQNKAKEWGDMCGGDHHVCSYADYPDAAGGKNLNGTPATFVAAKGNGATTLLNRFIDNYANPPGDPNPGAPTFDVTASLQICPQNAGATPADEPGQRFTASTFDALTPGTLTVQVGGIPQPTSNNASGPHAANSDPVGNSLAQTNAGRCPVEHSQGGAASAGAGVATYDSDVLGSDQTMLGQTVVTVPHTGAGSGGHQLNARLYDLFPDGTQVMVDRGVRRVLDPNETTVFLLHGNGWKFPKGHRIRIELTQDDNPYIKSSSQPSSLVLGGVKLDVPVREGSSAIGGLVPPQPSAGAGSGGSAGGSSGVGGGRSSRTLDVSLLSSRLALVRHGVFLVRCRAPGTGRRACFVVAERGSNESRVVRVGSGRGVIRRRSTRVRVRLNRRGRRLLRRHPRRGVLVMLRLRVRDASGRTGTARKRVRLKAVRRR